MILKNLSISRAVRLRKIKPFALQTIQIVQHLFPANNSITKLKHICIFFSFNQLNRMMAEGQNEIEGILIHF